MGKNKRRKGGKKAQWKKVNQKKDGSGGRENSHNFVEKTVEAGNFKMEAYYAVQGLHHYSSSSTSTDGAAAKTTTTLQPNTTFEAWNKERLAWREALGRVLPASFRFCQCNQIVSDAMKQEMDEQLKDLLQQAKEWKAPPDKEEEKDGEKDDADQTKEEGDDAKEKGGRSQQRLHPPIVYEPVQEKDVTLTHIPFCPYGYQLPLDRTLIRKHPALKPLHHWLMNKTDCGHITRQETVSMIPPIVLLQQYDKASNEKGHAILDMCAAPGSKTSQLLEGLASQHQERLATQQPKDDDNNNNNNNSIYNTGLLVANDVNPSRAHMLMHQLKRILHHFPVALVTAAPAQHFPSPPGKPGEGRLFDKILADVPCSGDGTTRKNIHVWKTWSQMGALALHKLQFDIAWKGAATLLKIGGYLCYSTCSLNPVEDEAVVAELLRRAEGNLELVDLSQVLGTFGTRPGISTWKVLCEPVSRRELKNRQKKQNAKMQQKRKEYEERVEKEQGGDGEEKDTKQSTEEDATGDVEMQEESKEQAANDGENDAEEEAADEKDDAPPPGPKIFEPTSMDEDHLMDLATNQGGLAYFESMDKVPEDMQSRIRPSNFPPTPEEAARFHLERCIRVLAHDNDTGGFFVALLKKVGPVGGQDRRDEKKAAAAEAATEDTPGSPPHKKAKLDDEEKTESMETEDKAEASTDVGEATGESSGDKKNGDEGAPARGKRNPKFEPEFVPVKDKILDPLFEFYGMGGPGFRKDLFMSRAGESEMSKVLTFVSPAVKDLLDHNMDIQKRVSIISTGLKAFTKNTASKDTPITHRLAQEAAHFLVPHMSDKRKFSISIADFETALGVVSTSNEQDEGEGEANNKGNNKGKKKQNPMNLIEIEKFSPEFGKRARGLDVGAFVTVLEGYENRLDEKMVLVMWRCRGDHVNTLVAKTEVESLVSKLKIIKKEQAS